MIFVWFDIGSRVTLTMAQINNYKAPPKLTDDVDYENWKEKKRKEKKKKEIKIWRTFTSLEKQALLIFWCVQGKPVKQY